MSTPLEVSNLLEEMRKWYGWTNTTPPRQMFAPSEQQAEIWASLLADLPIAALFAAWKQWLADNKYPPAPSDLRALARALITPLEQAAPDVDQAWSEVIRQIGAVGHTGLPMWSHPAIAEAVKGMGGWKLMCAMEIEDTATHRAQFRDTYRAAAARVTRGDSYLPDVRALAQSTGALPAPTPDAPVLPAPEETATEPPPAAPSSVVSGGTLRFAGVRRYRAEERAKREQAGRDALAQWLASQGGQDAAV